MSAIAVINMKYEFLTLQFKEINAQFFFSFCKLISYIFKLKTFYKKKFIYYILFLFLKKF